MNDTTKITEDNYVDSMIAIVSKYGALRKQAKFWMITTIIMLVFQISALGYELYLNYFGSNLSIPFMGCFWISFLTSIFFIRRRNECTNEVVALNRAVIDQAENERYEMLTGEPKKA